MELINSAVTVVVWLPYFIFSDRVKETFVVRVKEEGTISSLGSSYKYAEKNLAE